MAVPALSAAEDAVDVYRELAAARPDAFRSELARSLSILASQSRDSGLLEQARGAAAEAVALRRELAAAHPDAFQPDLASALHNFASFLSALGRWDEALGAVQEAAQLYRELAVAHPDAFRPYLATALNNLADALSRLGRRGEALAVVQEAAAIRREVAERTGAAEDWRSLAISLGQLGRYEEAHAVAQKLAGQTGTAEDWCHLSLLCGRAGRHEEAVDAARRALEIDPLFITARESFALNLEKLGRHEEGLEAARRVLEIAPGSIAARRSFVRSLEKLGRHGEAAVVRRELTAAYPDAFRPEAPAATAVEYLAPYLAEARREGAKKIGGAAADGAVRLLGFLKDKLRGTAGEAALAEVEAEPSDQLNQAVLLKHLRDALAVDPGLRDELQGLLDALPEPTAEQRMAIQGNRNIGVQATGSGIDVDLGGRGA